MKLLLGWSGLFVVVAGAISHPTVQAAPPAAPAATPAAAPAAAPAMPAVSGSVASREQMRQALEAAGVPPPRSGVGAAIGMAESGGRLGAVHLCPPTCEPGQAPERSFGPWQINLLAHPWVSRACAMALACAARATATISAGGSNWWPWSTYQTGAWRAFA